MSRLQFFVAKANHYSLAASPAALLLAGQTASLTKTNLLPADAAILTLSALPVTITTTHVPPDVPSSEPTTGQSSGGGGYHGSRGPPTLYPPVRLRREVLTRRQLARLAQDAERDDEEVILAMVGVLCH